MENKNSHLQKALDKAYKEAGHNAYFSNGFYAGVKFGINEHAGLRKIDLSFVSDALNHYFHDAVKNLQRDDLGDIERRSYEKQKAQAKAQMDLIKDVEFNAKLSTLIAEGMDSLDKLKSETNINDTRVNQTDSGNYMEVS